MMFIDLKPGHGSEVALSIPRFRSLTVLFALPKGDKPMAPGCPGYGMLLNGAMADEISVVHWPVGSNVYLSQPDSEITKGRDGLDDRGEFRERFHYHRILHGGAAFFLLLPPSIGKLIIISDQGYRDAGKNGEKPPVIMIKGSDDCPIPDIPIEIRASGVSLDAETARVITGVIRNPGDIHLPPETGDRVSIKEADRKDWMLEGSLQVSRMPIPR